MKYLCNELSKMKRLNFLGLGFPPDDTYSGDKEVDAICQAMKNLHNLTSIILGLDWQSNGIKSKGIYSIADLLATKTLLRRLDLGVSQSFIDFELDRNF